MKQILTICFLFSSMLLFGQTKKIAYKSHSGSTENFSYAVENDLFDMGNSNFGHAPQRDVVTAQLDSVIYVCDTLSILVTSEYCARINRATSKPVSDPLKWKAGREMAFHHPLFSRQHSLDSIKRVIREQYNFQNSVEKVVFVGFDNKKKKYKGFSVVPVGNNNDQSPFGGQFVWILSCIAVVSLLAAAATWRYYQWKNPAKAATAQSA